MCGIAATLSSPDLYNRPDLLIHRGTRSRSLNSKWGQVSHIRLPIVGVGPEHDQPVTQEGWTIAFVGEILDFREEKPDAECDLDTVVQTWIDEGPEGFRERDGFWSIVALDEIEGRLHVLCDYLAQKPMYYRIDVPAVASEPEALAVVAPVTVDKIYLSSVIKWGYCPDIQRTPYNEVKRVLPGEHVEMDRDGIVSRRIVDPLLSTPRADLREEIEAAVRRRVTSSDVPVAALVSGGLDSSIVFGLAKRYGDVRPYYVQDGRHDPEEWAAVHAVTKGYELTVVSEDHASVPLSEAVAIMQEPLDLGSLLPQIALSRAVEERVCLTGDGADEFFGGYSRAWRYDSQASDVWQELVGWHLPRLDRVMMRRQIEVRSPFLARRVAGAALALPWSQRNGGKMILREMFADVLPKEVSSLRKIPLKTKAVEVDREGNSKKLVEEFMRRIGA